MRAGESGDLYVVTEAVAGDLASVEAAIPLMEAVFLESERGGVELLPVAITAGFAPGSSFGAKGGIIRPMRLFGFKLGCYWPANAARGLPSHGSTTILNDPDTGFPMAIIGAKRISAIRTAALDAVAVRLLSRADSRTLAVIGCGVQGWHEVLAVRIVRPIERVLAWSRDPASAAAFARRVSTELGIPAEAAGLEDAVRRADIVVTATPSPVPLVERAWVRPGTHISAMGADTAGKLELAPGLVGSACLFADVVEQSVTIGEFKAAFAQGLIDRGRVTPIGRIIGTPGPQRAADDITVFDSSGTAIQDLVIAKIVLDAAIARGLAITIPE